MRRVSVPIGDLQAHLRGYQAKGLPEYSNNQRHVYQSQPMGLYITVRRKGGSAELEFTSECPCAYED
jgi:hypothetical protein